MSAPAGWNDSATVFKCLYPLVLCKKYLADGTWQDYDKAKHFDAGTFALAGFSDLVSLLGQLPEWHNAAIVPGALIGDLKQKRIRKISTPNPDCPATIRAVAHRWAAIDFDSIPCLPSLDRRDLCACAHVVISTIPSEFHGVRCVVTATAGHGIKPGLRLRLWFPLSRMTSLDELKYWLRSSPVDQALYRPAQFIYTAKPQFIGRSDPLPSRFAMLGGKSEVIVPLPEVLIPIRHKRLVQANTGSGASYAGGTFAFNGSPTMFACLLHRVATAPEGTRHDTLRAAARTFGGMIDTAQLNEDDIYDALMDAAERAGLPEEEASLAIEWGLDTGRAQPLRVGSEFDNA
jgi:hypothetical protein